MIAKIYKTAVFTLFLFGVELILIFILSTLDNDNLLVNSTSCLVSSSDSCGIINYFTIFFLLALNIGLSLLISSISIFKEYDDWKEDVKKRVAKIQYYYSSNDDVKLKHALVESDKLLGYVLNKKGIKGEKMYDQINNAKVFLSKQEYKDLKSARWARNKIVHEVDFQIKNEDIKRHIWSFRKAILSIIK